MKKLLLALFGICMGGLLMAQTYPYVDVNQIKYVSPTDLQNCNDSSSYLNDTIRTIGIVVTSGNLSEVASGSVQGGSRPFIAIVDTANGGAPGPFKGAVIMGAYNSGGSLVPSSDIENALAGDILEITCVVTEFSGLIQLVPVDANSVNILGFTSNPTFATISAGDIQDQNRQNILTTGEQWDGSYVELQNMTVTSVSLFSGGSRCEFTIADANGNQVLVADRFLPMRLAGNSTVNPNSPLAQGTLIAPSVGTFYNHVRGVIFQDENGCAGGSSFAGGYEINPFDSTDFDKAASPANIAAVKRVPVIPNASQGVTVSADITDNDGTVTSATVYYSSNINAARNLFSSVSMTNTGSRYSAVIPAHPLDTLIRYYIVAIDDSANVTESPSTTGYYYYRVRPNGPTVMDIQYVLDPASGASPMEGDTITVKGIVTSSYQPDDMGYLYIQDPSSTEYAGIFVEGGGTSVFALHRGDEVSVNGIVNEQFGFTKLVALSVTPTGNTGSVSPVVLDPSDTALFGTNNVQLEKYESMLIRFENPMVGGKVNIINPNLGFGEFSVGSGAGATTTARVLAGRQSGTSAQSSLNVSVNSDTMTYGSGLNVPPVQASITQNMDALLGQLYYSFSNFKLTPRNNADFVGFNQPLVGIEPIYTSNIETSIYPNPANDRVNVQISNEHAFQKVNIQVLDLTGRVVVDMQSALHLSSINMDGLNKGVYMIRVLENGQVINASKLILQ